MSASSALKGIGVDAVDIERFRISLERTPSMRQRLFVAEELDYVSAKVDPVPSLAARFAAREAVMKAMGLGRGDHVAILMPNGEDWILLFYGAALLGAVTVPVNVPPPLTEPIENGPEHLTDAPEISQVWLNLMFGLSGLHVTRSIVVTVSRSCWDPDACWAAVDAGWRAAPARTSDREIAIGFSIPQW